MQSDDDKRLRCQLVGSLSKNTVTWRIKAPNLAWIFSMSYGMILGWEPKKRSSLSGSNSRWRPKWPPSLSSPTVWPIILLSSHVRRRFYGLHGQGIQKWWFQMDMMTSYTEIIHVGHTCIIHVRNNWHFLSIKFTLHGQKDTNILHTRIYIVLFISWKVIKWSYQWCGIGYFFPIPGLRTDSDSESGSGNRFQFRFRVRIPALFWRPFCDHLKKKVC